MVREREREAEASLGRTSCSVRALCFFIRTVVVPCGSKAFKQGSDMIKFSFLKPVLAM